MQDKPFSVINALWPWPFDSEINRAHPRLIGSLCMKFHDDRWKGKAVVQHKPFSITYALWPWPFDPEINRTYPRLMWSLCMKFHDYKCKGKAIMRYKPVINALWPWPLDPKINKAHPWLIRCLCMKFHDDKCKGKAFMCRNYFTYPWHFQLSMHCDLDPKITVGHILMWSFMMIGVKGKQLCDWTILLNHAPTDGW